MRRWLQAFQWKRMGTLALGLWVLFAVASCSSMRRIQAEAPELVDVVIEGKEGHGEVRAELSEAGLERLLGLDGDQAPDDALVEKRRALAAEVDVVMTPQHRLKENDKVTLELRTDVDAWKALGVDLKTFPWTVTVHDLEPLEPLDLTEGLVLVPSGYSGEGTVEVRNPLLDEKVAAFVRYDIEPSKGLSNGDPVRVVMTVQKEGLAALGYEAEAVSDVQLRVEGFKVYETIDPLAKLEVVYEGYDGDGTATLVNSGVPAALEEHIQLSIVPERGLHNGDSVRATATYDASELRKRGYLVARHERMMEVDKLVAYRAIDPFEHLEPIISGVSGEATAELGLYELPEVLEGRVDMVMEGAEDLRNGDTLRVKVEADLEDLKRDGIKLTRTTLEFPIEGLKETPASLNAYDLTEVWAEAETQARAVVQRRIIDENRWQSRRTQSTWETEMELEPIKAFYMASHSKPEDNRLSITYKVEIEGRITAYRRGLLEWYSRGAQERQTIYVTVAVPRLIFVDGEVASVAAVTFLGSNKQLANAVRLGTRYAENGRMLIAEVDVP